VDRGSHAAFTVIRWISSPPATRGGCEDAQTSTRTSLPCRSAPKRSMGVVRSCQLLQAVHAALCISPAIDGCMRRWRCSRSVRRPGLAGLGCERGAPLRRGSQPPSGWSRQHIAFESCRQHEACRAGSAAWLRGANPFNHVFCLVKLCQLFLSRSGQLARTKSR
jgi:hypothetical protein